MKTYQDEYIWIIGASSGIGQALAGELAKRGAHIILTARRQNELEQLQTTLAGVGHLVCPCDVTDSFALTACTAELQARLPRLDRVLFMAAAYDPMPLSQLDLVTANRMIDVNVKGCLNIIAAAWPLFAKQGYGQMAICASVAGYRGLAGGQPYSATKAALINLTESLRLEAREIGVDVRLINPGFVRTPLTDKNTFKMPMMVEADQAAKYIADGLQSNRFMITFPPLFGFLMRVMAMLPYGVYFSLARRFKSNRI
jgi:short-subunit dehydrogenase